VRDPYIPSPGNAAVEPNPHRRLTAHRLPAGSFFGGFRTPAPSLRVDRSRQAGIRNPSRFRTLAEVGCPKGFDNTAALRDQHIVRDVLINAGVKRLGRIRGADTGAACPEESGADGYGIQTTTRFGYLRFE
jgi:hypothetical protein